MIATTLICITVVTLIISTSLPKKNIVGAISIYTITFEALMFFTKIGDMALIINMTQIASLMLVKYGGQEKVKMEIIDMVLLIIAVIATVSLDTYITAINF